MTHLVIGMPDRSRRIRRVFGSSCGVPRGGIVLDTAASEAELEALIVQWIAFGVASGWPL